MLRKAVVDDDDTNNIVEEANKDDGCKAGILAEMNCLARGVSCIFNLSLI